MNTGLLESFLVLQFLPNLLEFLLPQHVHARTHTHSDGPVPEVDDPERKQPELASDSDSLPGLVTPSDTESDIVSHFELEPVGQCSDDEWVPNPESLEDTALNLSEGTHCGAVPLR
jgi:hypothetical protein